LHEAAEMFLPGNALQNYLKIEAFAFGEHTHDICKKALHFQYSQGLNLHGTVNLNLGTCKKLFR